MIATPFFSVVIPVYNKGPHISRAIESVLKQTFTDFELLVVCDPSTDNSTDMVEKYRNEGITILHRDKPGPGGYAARNLGIINSKGQWIAFLDADDEWVCNHLELLFHLTSDYPDAKILGAGWLVKEHNFNGELPINKFHSKASNKPLFFNTNSYLRLELKSERPFYTRSEERRVGKEIRHTQTSA